MTGDDLSMVIDADVGLVGVGSIGQKPEVREALGDTVAEGPPTLRVDATSLVELVSAICGAQSRMSTDLLLHAAAVVEPSGTSAVLLSGPSMAGKSTFCAWLVQHGWGYLSDELVRVKANGEVSAWRKPISLRQSSEELLGLVAPSLVPASVLGSVTTGSFPVSGVVLLESRPTGISPLGSADAVARLMQEATRFDGGDHLYSLASVMQRATAIRLGRASLEEQQRAVEQLCAHRMTPSVDVSTEDIERVALKDEVTAVAFGEELVAYNEISRRVSVIDLRALPTGNDETTLSAQEMLRTPTVSTKR